MIWAILPLLALLIATALILPLREGGDHLLKRGALPIFSLLLIGGAGIYALIGTPNRTVGLERTANELTDVWQDDMQNINYIVRLARIHGELGDIDRAEFFYLAGLQISEFNSNIYREYVDLMRRNNRYIVPPPVPAEALTPPETLRPTE